MNNIKKIRLTKNLNQTDFATLFGVTHSYIYQIEHGIRPISLDLAKKISKKFDVSLNEIYNEIKLPYSNNLDDLIASVTKYYQKHDSSKRLGVISW